MPYKSITSLDSRLFCSRHEESPLEAEVVKLRYFVGLTHEEAAEALGISVRTAKNYWAHARAWLFQAIMGAVTMD